MRSALLFLTAFLFCASADAALADKRVALVIGMSKYQQVPKLTNPSRDADAVAALFKNAGFDVIDSERDLGIADLRRAIRRFSETSRDADIAVVYYAGHGIEVDGTNYLIPADAKLTSDFDIEDETISLDRILKALESAKRLKLVILDACRDNPFSTTMKRSVASRSIGRGLAKIEPAMSDTLVAFAAKAGAVASDGDGENSPFATALVKYITEPGLDLRLAFGRVRDDVLKNTSNRQEPFVYGSLGGETMALVPAASKPVDAEAQARVDYELAAQVGTKQAWDSFLRGHATGYYSNLARAQNDKLTSAQQTRAKADDARRDAEAQAEQKAVELRRQLEEQSVRQTAEVKQKLSEQAKKDLEAARRQLAEQAKKELDDARRQVEIAQRQAEAARQQVEDTKRQAIADAQRQVEQAKVAAKADEARRDAEEQAAQKAVELRRQLEEQSVRQTAEVKQKLSEQAKKDFEDARRQLAEQAKKELDDARLQVEIAQRQADAARRQVEDTKRQAIADAQRQAEEAKVAAKTDEARRDAEEQAAQKTVELRRQLEEQSLRQTAEVKQKLSEQAKKDLEDARRQLAEQAKKELDDARRQVEIAQQQADAARQQVEDTKRQAIADAQRQVEEAKVAARADAEKVASLDPSQAIQPPPAPAAHMDQADIIRLLQAHLKRVGCDAAEATGTWDDGSRKALDLFNKNAQTAFDVKLASLDALDAVRSKPDRVCPLVCGKGQRADGDRCVQIGCAGGFFLNSSGACEKRQEPAPKARTAAKDPAPRRSAPSGGGKCFAFNGKSYCE